MGSDSTQSKTIPVYAREDVGTTPVFLSIVVPTIGIAISEYFLFTGRQYDALWGHFITLAVCLVLSLRYSQTSAVYRSFALVPVFRLVNFGMPIFYDLTLFWLALVYVPLIPAAYVILRADPLLEFSSNTSLDIYFLLKAFLLLVLGIPLAYVLAMGEYWIIEPEALIPSASIENLLLLGIIQIAVVGFVEELVFRGVLQRGLQVHLNRWVGLFLASAIFGLMHSAYGLELLLVYAGTVGFVFGLIYDLTDSVIYIAFLHGLLNVFVFGFFPFFGAYYGVSFLL